MKSIVLLFISISFAFGLSDLNITDENVTDENATAIAIALALEEDKKIKTNELLSKINILEEQILKEKVWMKSYSSYLTSQEVGQNLHDLQKRIAYLKKKRKKSASQINELSSLVSKEKIIASQVVDVNKNKDTPFSDLLTPPDIDEKIVIKNPFDMFNGLSLVKTLNMDLENYIQRKEKLKDLISIFTKENELYKKLLDLNDDNKYIIDAKYKQKRLEKFETAYETIAVTADVYQKRLELVELNLNKQINEQMWKIANIVIIILIILSIFFILKFSIKKYISDNERFYMANKIINFGNVTLILLIIFFSYIENAGSLITILGFASAGIAIAMKDWFMSILGWLVIVFGGSIHVGDRIRVDMDGMKYVGDVMDISLLRMTIFEDITLTSIVHNRRAGRIIFIPNNYVFTKMIANYTHSSLKTVWDGVHVTITFDSNHKKAMYLAKDITRKYSKGYTDITRKQLNKLRHSYSLKNTNVDPRIFSFIEPNGISIDAWYLTNAYATLTLRSTISTEIIDAFNKEEDIKIAYPTQSINLRTNDDELDTTKHEVV